MKVKALLRMVAKDNGLNLEKLGNSIGRPYHSLNQSLTNESLSVKDWVKCFDSVGEPLYIIYKNDKILIENENK